MTRYYFDLQDDNGIAIDEEGLELANLERVEVEAARSLADIARDETLSGSGKTTHRLAIEVRDDDGPLLEVTLAFKMDRHRAH